MRHRFGRLEGTVTAFDAEVGLGTVEVGDGRSWVFHCTAIADGSRRIDVGTLVGFELSAGGPGAWEAADVAPIGSVPGEGSVSESGSGSGSVSGSVSGLRSD